MTPTTIAANMAKKPTKKSAKALPFETALEQLEELIDQIESGEVGLEAALEHHAEGARLIQHCRSILDTAERRIAELTVNADGDLTTDGEPDDE